MPTIVAYHRQFERRPAAPAVAVHQKSSAQPGRRHTYRDGAAVPASVVHSGHAFRFFQQRRNYSGKNENSSLSVCSRLCAHDAGESCNTARNKVVLPNNAYSSFRSKKQRSNQCEKRIQASSGNVDSCLSISTDVELWEGRVHQVSVKLSRNGHKANWKHNSQPSDVADECRREALTVIHPREDAGPLQPLSGSPATWHSRASSSSSLPIRSGHLFATGKYQLNMSVRSLNW